MSGRHDRPRQPWPVGWEGRVPIASLRPVHAHHPDETEDLCWYLSAGGAIPALTVAPDGTILDGHHRYYSLKALGSRSAPVYVMAGSWAEEMEAEERSRAIFAAAFNELEQDDCGEHPAAGSEEADE